MPLLRPPSPPSPTVPSPRYYPIRPSNLDWIQRLPRSNPHSYRSVALFEVTLDEEQEQLSKAGLSFVDDFAPLLDPEGLLQNALENELCFEIDPLSVHQTFQRAHEYTDNGSATNSTLNTILDFNSVLTTFNAERSLNMKVVESQQLDLGDLSELQTVKAPATFHQRVWCSLGQLPSKITIPIEKLDAFNVDCLSFKMKAMHTGSLISDFKEDFCVHTGPQHRLHTVPSNLQPSGYISTFNTRWKAASYNLTCDVNSCHISGMPEDEVEEIKTALQEIKEVEFPVLSMLTVDSHCFSRTKLPKPRPKINPLQIRSADMSIERQRRRVRDAEDEFYEGLFALQSASSERQKGDLQ